MAHTVYTSCVSIVTRRALSPFFIFFGLEGSWGQPQGPNFPSPWATMLALRLDCSTTALTTPQKVLSLWRLIELKKLDFSDRTRTGISILTSAADPFHHFGAFLSVARRSWTAWNSPIHRFWGSKIVKGLVGNTYYRKSGRRNPTGLCTILEHQDASSGTPEQHKIRRSPDREALKLGKGRSGENLLFPFHVDFIHSSSCWYTYTISLF